MQVAPLRKHQPCNTHPPWIYGEKKHGNITILTEKDGSIYLKQHRAWTKRSSNSEGRMVVHARRLYACLCFPHFSLRISHVFGHAYADLSTGTRLRTDLLGSKQVVFLGGSKDLIFGLVVSKLEDQRLLLCPEGA